MGSFLYYDLIDFLEGLFWNGILKIIVKKLKEKCKVTEEYIMFMNFFVN